MGEKSAAPRAGTRVEKTTQRKFAPSSGNWKLNENRKVIDVVAALIRDTEGRYLVGQRAAHKSQGGLWEFMGGKIERGESPEEALARECREELALEIENCRVVDSVVHEYPEKTINLILISCTPKSGSTPIALEHQAIRWVLPAEMKDMPFCPADVELIEKVSLGV